MIPYSSIAIIDNKKSLFDIQLNQLCVQLTPTAQYYQWQMVDKCVYSVALRMVNPRIDRVQETKFPRSISEIKFQMLCVCIDVAAAESFSTTANVIYPKWLRQSLCWIMARDSIAWSLSTLSCDDSLFFFSICIVRSVVINQLTSFMYCVEEEEKKKFEKVNLSRLSIANMAFPERDIDTTYFLLNKMTTARQYYYCFDIFV